MAQAISEELLSKSLLVVAHPDDEILWFSSIIEKVDKVIICFLGNSDYPKRAKSRLRVLEKLPLNNIECLGLDVPKVFGQAAWPHPVEVAEGLEVVNQKDYVSTYDRLLELLSETILTYENVFTHNPWGEYGHEEHVLVHKAVQNIATQSDADTGVWFSNYVSPRSASLAARHLTGKHQKHFTMQTQPDLGEQFKKLYLEEGCWTAPNDFVWFSEECFTKLPNAKSNSSVELYNMFPTNLLTWPQLPKLKEVSNANFLGKSNLNDKPIFKDMQSNKKWLFVLGCYNSGTTLLEKLIGVHPDVSGMPMEGQFCTDQFTTPVTVGLPRLWAEKPELFLMHEGTDNGVDADKVKMDWLKKIVDPKAGIYLEKSCPNSGRIRWLNKHFENAYFLAIIRNGYAVAEGISRKAGHPIEKSANQWVISNDLMLRDLKKVNNSMLITYEDLAEKTEDIMGSIWSFLGVDPLPHNDSQVMHVHGVKSEITNMNNKSFDSLDNNAKTVIRSLGAELLDKFAYKSE